jgi:alpha-galactosidase
LASKQTVTQGERDKNGIIREDATKYPSGLPALISQLHSRGLLVGLTTDIGNFTVCGRPGSAGFEKNDAATYASWG